MKMILFIFVAAMMSASAFAADILLKDGRVFKDAVIMSQTPRTVMIKHTTGLSSVAKELLPPEIQAQYPVDEAAARESERQTTIAREVARESEKTETERIARIRAQREATAASNDARAENDAARE